MNAKRIVTVGLLVFVGASVVYLVIQETTATPAIPAQTGQAELAVAESGAGGDAKLNEPKAQVGHKLIAYYFHRNKRCKTCLTIETFAEDALKDAFPEALSTGELEWRTVNVEEPANEHFVEDYELTSSELVLVDTRNGEQKEWRNLQRVWELVGDELKFKAYVESEAMLFLE